MELSRKLPLVLAPLVIAAAWPQSVLAQAVAPATQGATTGPATPGAATAPSTQQATTTSGKKIKFNFERASVDSVLNYLASAAGYVVIKPAGGIPSNIQPVTINSPTEISPERAIEVLNAALQSSGYSVVISGNDIISVVPTTDYRRMNAPVHYGADPKDISDSQDIITQVIPVTSVDAVRLRNDLIPLLSPNADSAANTGSNTIIITDTSASIKRAVTIIQSIDVHKTDTTAKIVRHLNNASATSAAQLLTTVFRPTTAAAAGGGFPGGGGRGNRGGGGPGGGGNNGAPAADNPLAGQITASADDRTNTIVVIGPTATIAAVSDILDQLDKDQTVTTVVFHYPLKNAQAANLQSVLNSLFGVSGTTGGTTNRGTTGTTSTIGGFGAGTTGRGGAGGRGGSTGGGLSSIGSFGGTGTGTTANRGTTGGGGISGIGGGRGGASSIASIGASGTTSGNLIGQAFVVADPDTNSLIVTTATGLENEVKAIINELDRPVPQVVIKVLIAEVTHNNSDDIGVEFSAINTRVTALGKTLGLQAGSAFGTAGQTGGLIVGLVEDNVNATLRALATAGKLDVLSRPYILASDNQQASMIVGQEVPIITDSRLDINNNAINTISYQDLGIILTVTPHINPQGLVIMDVAPEISQISDQSVPISSTVSAPVFIIRAAQTRVAIENGKTIVIGGLMQDQKTQSVSKIPILGDIPFLGMAFKRTINSKQKTELMIFLTPHVALSPEYLNDMSDDERRGMQIIPNAISPGSWDSQIRGMERGATPANATQPEGRIEIPSQRRYPEGRLSPRQQTITPGGLMRDVTPVGPPDGPGAAPVPPGGNDVHTP